MKPISLLLSILIFQMAVTSSAQNATKLNKSENKAVNETVNEKFVDARSIRINLKKSIIIDYSSPSWNKSPDKIDFGLLIMKDIHSDQLISVEMQETSTDSSVFFGKYQIDLSKNDSQGTLEMYIPPQNLNADTQRFVKINKLIKDNILLRKPYFYRIEGDKQKITLYDSKLQALEAYRYFLRADTSSKMPLQNQALETKAMAQVDKLTSQNMAQAQDEAKLDLIKQKQEREKEQALLSEKLIAENKAKAASLAKLALEKYNKQNFQEALNLFDQSMALDPSNNSFYFQYGVTLFKLDRFEKALTYLQLDRASENKEQDYFIALSYLKLDQKDKAKENFTKLAQDKSLGPIATFYLGIIDMSQENFESAKNHFQIVLDTSTDNQLDQQAENYIEQIANILKYKELQKNRWTLTGNIGAQYDSNILTVSPDVVSTDLSGFRTTYGFNLEYRPIYSEKSEFAINLMYSDIYSTTSSLQPSSQFQNIDPLTTGVTAPFKRRGKLFDLPSQWGVTPYFKTIQMNADGIDTREAILQSTGVTLDTTLVQSDKVLHSTGLDLRQDNSFSSSSGDNDQDASYLGLTYALTQFTDDNQKEAWIKEASLGLNSATGKNLRYYLAGFNLGYLVPGYWDALWVAKVGVTHKNYSESTLGRQDNLLSLNLISQKKLSNTLQFSGGLIFNSSLSNIDSYKYNQFVILSQLIWQKAF